MSLGPSLRKNYINVKARMDGEKIDDKIANMKNDLPRYNPPQRQTRIEDILQENSETYEAEKDLLKEMLGGTPGSNAARPQRKIQVSLRDARDGKTTTLPQQIRISAGGGNNLMTSMVSRLSALEKSHKKMRLELVAKDKALLKLRRKCQMLKEENTRLSNSADDSDNGTSESEGGKCQDKKPSSMMAIDKVLELESKNQRLRKQIHEMESFLKDYGLVWVGREMAEDVEPVVPEVDFSLFFCRLKELNGLAGDGKPKIVASGKMAKFEHQKGIPIKVYKDGIFLFRGPFRSFSSGSGKKFLMDILDGYFPSEFKDEYPDGVLFEYKDFSDTLYGSNDDGAESSSFSAFGGVGKSLQSPKMNTEEFLNRLPEKVICGGEVIEIRKGIADKLASSMKKSGSDGTDGNLMIPDMKSNEIDFKLRNNEDRVARAARFAAAFEKRTAKK